MLIALQVVLGLIAAVWFLTMLGNLRAIFQLPKPAPIDSIGAEELEGRLVSIIVAARDELGRIEETVRRALAQEGVPVEVIAVDDRSTDGTGESLDALAAEHQSLRIVHIESLPDGWLGKCHALHQGAAIASGDWLLFLDADTHLTPGAVAGALAVGLRERVAHVTLLPGLVLPSFWGQVTMGSFWVQMGSRAMQVNRCRPMSFMGIGAFNLITKEAYRAFGGHERLKMQVVDDITLGLCVRKTGEQTRVLDGQAIAEVEYGTDLPTAFRLFEKNGYAALNYNFPLLLAASVIIPSFVLGALLGPVWALLFGAWAGWFALAGVITWGLPALIVTRKTGGSRLAALLTPLGHLFFLLALQRSTIVTIKQGGVRWRETFYPLKELKQARLSWRVGVPLPEMESGTPDRSGKSVSEPSRCSDSASVS